MEDINTSVLLSEKRPILFSLEVEVVKVVELCAQCGGFVAFDIFTWKKFEFINYFWWQLKIRSKTNSIIWMDSFETIEGA